jgi:hypothetical protein
MSNAIGIKHGQTRRHLFVASRCTRRQYNLVTTRAMSWRLASRYSWLSVFSGIDGHESTTGSWPFC